MNKESVFNIGLNGLRDFLVDNRFPKYRAKQVFDWLKKGVLNFSDMKNLPGDLIEFLGRNFYICSLEKIDVKKDEIDSTEKYLFKNLEGMYIETVLMKYKYGNTVCVSSQCGCRMGCDFCATGKDGFDSNLSVADMISQIMLLDSKVNHIVIMGMGEPFDNYENVKDFINFVNSKDFFNIGFRAITVSTCGIIDKIDDFEKDFPQVNLAISLHSAVNDTRSRLMPINNKYPVSTLIDRIRKYTINTGRRVTFEYSLLSGINDTESERKALIEAVKGINCHINLIPFNPIGEGKYRTSDNINQWFEKLTSNNIQVTIRRSLGTNIDGACGQLRRNRKS